ncbi:MAG: hypothetical protein JSR61_17735 [Proteobacteria bacterium]|nr:hypothetical protein [Pseudomonadota bacterium]
MHHLHTDIVQSFWLRFWREPHRGPHREWRGSIWHEQQAVHDKPTMVANPEEAFEFVRRVLSGQGDQDQSPTHGPRARPMPDDAGERTDRGWPRDWLKAFWRRSRGAKP